MPQQNNTRPSAYPTTAGSRAIHETAVGDANYQFQRIECMDGDMARNKDQKRGNFNRHPDAQVGEICRLTRDYSADVHRDAAARARRPGEDLLAPFRDIALDKGYRPTNENARYMVNLINGVSVAYGAQKGKVSLPLPSGENLEVTTGAVLDAAYTATVIDFGQGATPTPRRTTTLPQNELTLYGEGCARNNGSLTMAQCKALGQEQAADYLQQRRGSARRP